VKSALPSSKSNERNEQSRGYYENELVVEEKYAKSD